MSHERAIKAAVESIWKGCDINEREARKCIAVFLENVEPSDAMVVAAGQTHSPPVAFPVQEKAAWRTMSKALAEELKRP